MRKNVAILKFGWQAALVLILTASLLKTTFSAEKLTPESVARLVPSLFNLHLIQHSMTPSFTKRVIKEYLTQLDPYNRFYLKSETDAILNKSDDELKQLGAAVLKGDLSLFRNTLDDFIKVQIARDDKFYATLDERTGEIKAEAERLDATKKNDAKTPAKKALDATPPKGFGRRYFLARQPRNFAPRRRWFVEIIRCARSNRRSVQPTSSTPRLMSGRRNQSRSRAARRDPKNKTPAKKALDGAPNPAPPDAKQLTEEEKKKLAAKSEKDDGAGDDDDEDADSKIKWTEHPATHEDRMARLIKFAAGSYRMNKSYLSEAQAMTLALQNVSEEHKKFGKLNTEVEMPKMFLKAFMAAMDPHTVYFDGDDEKFSSSLEPTFIGIGVKIRPCPTGAQVDDLIEGGPSEKSGKLHPGDQIIAVEGDSMGGLPINRIVQRIKGAKDTDVHLTIVKRLDHQTETITLRRAEIKLDTERIKVKRMNTPQGAVDMISVASFYRGVAADVRTRIEQSLEKPPAGIILDLRANQGGYLEEAVALAGLFIEEGPVVGERDAEDTVNWVSKRVDPNDKFFYAGPLVVLTSQLSASASEIVAGSLKDYNRGLIVGPTQTFGKGSVQKVIELNRTVFRLPGEIKITTNQYFCAGGESTQSKGVEPDLYIPGAKLVDDMLEKAARRMRFHGRRSIPKFPRRTRIGSSRPESSSGRIAGRIGRRTTSRRFRPIRRSASRPIRSTKTTSTSSCGRRKYEAERRSCRAVEAGRSAADRG